MKMLKNELIVYRRDTQNRICGLHGVIVEDTPTAYRVQLSKNPTIRIWFNKKAITKPEKVVGVEKYYECVLHDWFTGSEFFSSMWLLYSDTSVV